MPTAPKLIAAILLAATALIVAFVYRLGYPELTFKFGYYLLACCVGGIVGWFTLGQNPYFGGLNSILAGVRANAIMSVVGAIAFALVSVWTGMSDHDFSNPFQVPISLITRSVAYFSSALTVKIWTVMILGGAVSGRITGIANFHWR
jgi:hypothetical protein